MSDMLNNKILLLIIAINTCIACTWLDTYSREDCIPDPKDSYEKLLRDLKSDNISVQRHAACLIGQYKNPEAIEPLLAVVGTGRQALDDYAFKSLKTIGYEKTISHMQASLNGNDQHKRLTAMQANLYIKEYRLLGQLEKIASHNIYTQRERTLAADAILRINKKVGTDILMSMLTGDDLELVKGAVKVAESHRLSSTEGIMISLTHSENMDVKLSSIASLGEVGGEKSVIRLSELLNENGDILNTAIVALGDISNHASVNALMDLFPNCENGICLHITNSIYPSSSAAAPVLATRMDDMDYRVRLGALLTFYSHNRQQFSFDRGYYLKTFADRMINDKNQYVRAVAALCLSSYGYYDLLKYVRAALDKEKIYEYEKDCNKVNHPLEKLAQKETKGPRYAIIQLIARIGQPKYMEILIAEAGDKNHEYRSYVTSILEKFSGHKYGQNIEAWRKWWSENKHKYEQLEDSSTLDVGTKAPAAAPAE